MQHPLFASLQFGVAPLQQAGPPHVVPEQLHVLFAHVKPVPRQLPQSVVWPVPGFVIALQFPPGAPASLQMGGPLQKNPEASGPASAMQSWLAGHAFEQSMVLPQPSSSEGWQSLGKLSHVFGSQDVDPSGGALESDESKAASTMPPSSHASPHIKKGSTVHDSIVASSANAPPITSASARTPPITRV